MTAPVSHFIGQGSGSLAGAGYSGQIMMRLLLLRSRGEAR